MLKAVLVQRFDDALNAITAIRAVLYVNLDTM